MWLAIALSTLLAFIVGGLAYYLPDSDTLQNILMATYQLAYLLPIVIILASKRIKFKTLGFRKFTLINIGLGCGLLIPTYFIVFIHNSLLAAFGVNTQADLIAELLESGQNFIWLMFVGVLVAPFVEEIFFRGFVFAGFREAYGWKKSLLYSSIIFSVSHLQFAALIPTFVLSVVLTYLYQHSKSLWPGIILHFIVNSFGLIMIYLLFSMDLLDAL